MSRLEDSLYSQIVLSGLPPPEREFRFHPRRRWRWDLAWPKQKIAVEVQGGLYNRGRHVRAAGYEKDLEKENAGVMMGWKILKFSPRTINNLNALTVISTALEAVAWDDYLFG